jgi:hypothetical protein
MAGSISSSEHARLISFDGSCASSSQTCRNTSGHSSSSLRRNKYSAGHFSPSVSTNSPYLAWTTQRHLQRSTRIRRNSRNVRWRSGQRCTQPSHRHCWLFFGDGLNDVRWWRRGVGRLNRLHLFRLHSIPNSPEDFRRSRQRREWFSIVLCIPHPIGVENSFKRDLRVTNGWAVSTDVVLKRLCDPHTAGAVLEHQNAEVCMGALHAIFIGHKPGRLQVK